MDFRKSVAAGLAASVLFTSGVMAAPKDIRLISARVTPYQIWLNEQQANADAVMEQGRMMVPLRAIGEQLGATVTYGDGGIITVTLGDQTLQIKPGLDKFPPAFRSFTDKEAKENNLNRNSRIINGKTYVPVRYLAELLGGTVDWDGLAKVHIHIKLGKGSTTPTTPGDMTRLIPFSWYEMTADGPVFHSEKRDIEGKWYLDQYLKYMNFAVITSDKDTIAKEPLKTLLPEYAPKADYSKYVGLWAYLGQATTGGYSIKIEQVTSERNNIKVAVRLISPAPGDMVTEALSYPEDYVLVERALLGTGEKTVTFVDQNDKVLKTMKVDLTEKAFPGETAKPVVYQWYEMTEAGPVFHTDTRTIAGDWNLDHYLQYMDFAVIRSDKDYLSQPPLQTFAPILPPKADYTKYIGFWAYLGQASTGGHEIKVEKVSVEGSKVIVQVHLISPAPDAIVTEAINYPTDYAIVERSAIGSGEKTFVFTDQNGNVLKALSLSL